MAALRIGERTRIRRAADRLKADDDVREIQQLAGHTFITCNPEQEEEATWLVGCLLLREAYVGTSAEAIAAKYQVSQHMARFRLNTSGVLLQARRARRN